MSASVSSEDPIRDASKQIDAMVRALRELSAAALDDVTARADCYERAGLLLEAGHEAADDVAALHLARTYRDLFPGNRTGRPRLVDARIRFAGIRAFALLGREMQASPIGMEAAHG